MAVSCCMHKAETTYANGATKSNTADYVAAPCGNGDDVYHVSDRSFNGGGLRDSNEIKVPHDRGNGAIGLEIEEDILFSCDRLEPLDTATP